MGKGKRAEWGREESRREGRAVGEEERRVGERDGKESRDGGRARGKKAGRSGDSGDGWLPRCVPLGVSSGVTGWPNWRNSGKTREPTVVARATH